MFEAARTRLAFGQRLRRSRNRVLAREQLRAAVDGFDALGARPWAGRARAELAATGETHRRRDAAGIDDLTPQELQVALLLTSGKTTRETAAALFLSPKTVEYHCATSINDSVSTPVGSLRNGWTTRTEAGSRPFEDGLPNE